jgi:hypothetical protein
VLSVTAAVAFGTACAPAAETVAAGPVRAPKVAATARVVTQRQWHDAFSSVIDRASRECPTRAPVRVDIMLEGDGSIGDTRVFGSPDDNIDADCIAKVFHDSTVSLPYVPDGRRTLVVRIGFAEAGVIAS